MITSQRSTPVQIFISIHSAGASPQIGEILRVCDFFPGWLVILHFSRARTQVELMDGFSRFMAHTTYFRLRTVLLGVATISEFIWGDIPKNSPKRGVNRQFQAKPAEYKISRYLAKYKHDQHAILGEC